MNTLDEISMVGDKVHGKENAPAEHMRTCLKCTYTKFEADRAMARGEAGVHAVREAKGATRKGARKKCHVGRPKRLVVCLRWCDVWTMSFSFLDSNVFRVEQRSLFVGC
jgi:hypothetical protein